MMDYVFNLPRENKAARIVYSVFLDKKSIIDPRLVEVKNAMPDEENPHINKVFFGIS